MRTIPKRVLKKIAGEIDLTFSVWRKSREFKGDRNYDLDLVDRYFIDRRAEASDDSAILRRICLAYNKAKDFQRKVSPVFHPSNEWLPVYQNCMKEVIAALTNEDIVTLSRIYANYWRDPCSTGLVGLPLDMRKCFFRARINRRHKMLALNDALYRYKLWRSLLGITHSIHDLDSPCIGNPYGYFVDGTFIKSGSDYQHYYATLIGRLIRSERSKCIVELGAGFGGMAYYLLRDNRDVAYIDLDLPENMALTAYFLLKAFPQRKILLYGEVSSWPESIENNEILIMPSFEVTRFPSGCARLVFNSYSLAEMSRETINTFIEQFARIVGEGGYVLHVNHNKNSLVVADDFGMDSARFDLLYKIPALWNMGRNAQMDEYEYLYRRTNVV